MVAGDALGDRQTQAAVTTAAAGWIEALERLQRPFPVGGGDARTAIPHLQHKSILRSGSLGAAQHQPQGRRPMAEGVLQQVGQSPGQGRGPHPALQR